MTESIVVGVRLDPETIKSLKKIAIGKSLSSSKQITHNDLIRQAIFDTYGQKLKTDEFDKFCEGFAGISVDVQECLNDGENAEELLYNIEGSSILAKAIASAIKVFVEQYSIARRMLMTEIIPHHGLPRYEFKGNGSLIERLNKDTAATRSFKKGEVVVPSFEIVAQADVRLVDIKSKRLSIINAAVTLAALRIIYAEEKAYLSMLSKAIENQDRYLFDDVGMYFDDENEDNVLILSEDVTDRMRSYVRNIPAGSRASRAAVASKETLSVIVADHTISKQGFVVKKNQAVMPICRDITVLPADDPKRLLVGWVIYEEVGMATTESGIKALYAEN